MEQRKDQNISNSLSYILNSYCLNVKYEKRGDNTIIDLNLEVKKYSIHYQIELGNSTV